MANEEQLDLVRQGSKAWNQWRKNTPNVKIDLNEAHLNGVRLSGAHLSRADLYRAHLREADLREADLREADLREANLNKANLNKANLTRAFLRGAHLRGADLRAADLREVYLSKALFYRADLRAADLSKANLSEADLSGANLHEANLSETHLSKANLSGANLINVKLNKADLREANLNKANLSGANLSETYLNKANLGGADLSGADLNGADLNGADLSKTNLSKANLSKANLINVNLSEAILSETSLNETKFSWTTVVNVDLKTVKGLETVKHLGPSSIGIDTIYLSQGQIPESFLRGAGVPDSFITYMHSLTGEAIRYYTCFISYSTKDQDFAQRLHADLQAKGVRCWFAPEDRAGGKKLHEQIDQAIRVYDKLLVILSEHSMESEWVKTEIYNARQQEVDENRRKLFPLSLVAFDAIRHWKAFDADRGKDMAREVREYFIPDFSHWKEHDDYQQAFDRLLKDLKAEAL